MIIYRRATTSDLAEVLAVWERSVNATHHFLTTTDITMIKADLVGFLPTVELILALEAQTNKIIGFSSVAGKYLAMLFIDPTYIGKGIGSQFFDYMLTRYPFTQLEVNKDNPKALAFYLNKGFRIIEEKATDDQGRPFPLLVMEKQLDRI